MHYLQINLKFDLTSFNLIASEDEKRKYGKSFAVLLYDCFTKWHKMYSDPSEESNFQTEYYRLFLELQN